MAAKVDTRKIFLDVFHTLSQSRSPWQVWSDFITVTACAISNCVDKLHYEPRENTYLHIMKKYASGEADRLLALEENPYQDFLDH